MRTRGDEGFVLLNVLVVLALAATIAYAMMTVTDLSIARSQVFSQGNDGLALVRGAEQSAVAALRRDMIAAPKSDFAGEAWGSVAQQAITIAGGTFGVRVADAQGLYNLNDLAPGGGSDNTELLQAISDAAGLPVETVPRIVDSLATVGPLDSLADLSVRIGLLPEQIDRLGTLATVLPEATTVNLNSAPAALLTMLFGDSARVVHLQNQRDKAGFLTTQDLGVAGLELPVGASFRSDFFLVRTDVRIGETSQSVESLLHRQVGARGPEVVVARRRNLAGVLGSGFVVD